MKQHRCSWVLLGALALLGTVAATDAQAQRRFFYYSPPGPFVQNPSFGPVTQSYYNPWGYNPYVAPYPAYGVIPGPIILGAWQHGSESAYSGRTAEDYGYARDEFATPPRKRNALYPAVPFEKTPGDRLADIRRVRFEIIVPREDVVVLIDGVATQQTGLSRVYLTPPMDEDRLFTSEFELRWTDEAGKAQSIRRTFEFVAGETIRHTFK